MPVSAIPLSILQPFFNLIQPFFRCCIHRLLAEIREHGFHRSVFIRAGMRKDDIYFPTCSIKLVFCKFLNFIGWLLSRKPPITMCKPVRFVYGIRTA